jgi:hypothetical protein
VDSAANDMEAQCGAGFQPKLDVLSKHITLCCCCGVRRWCELADLPLLQFRTKHIWSLALVEADVDSAKHDMVAQCGAGGQPKLDLLTTYIRLWCCCYARRWYEPVDLPLLLSQTNYNWSLAPVEAHEDSAGGQPNLDLLTTHMRLWCCCYVSRWYEPLDLPLLLSKANYIHH